MFEALGEKLDKIFKKITGRGVLTEDNIKNALREVRLALLEADVNYKVVKKFIEDVKQRAIGQEVMESLTPGQQMIKIVNEELARLMGEEAKGLQLKGSLPYVIMLVGLQGSGKTTTAAKLAKYLKKKGKHPYLVSSDVYRPAAIEQLVKLASKIDVPIYQPKPKEFPIDICVNARAMAFKEASDILIIDTAGRLHIDQELMKELVDIKKRISPCEILLVADAMTGQDAVNIAKEFDRSLDITGVILTKIEGDARGGAALSIKAVTNKPIKFIGTGERLDEFELFHPDRIASKILGMGDILTLIEKAQEEFDQKEALRLQKKIKEKEFDLEDFLYQLKQIKKLGPLDQLLSMIPGFGQMKQLKKIQVDERELIKIEAIINSMTKEERRNFKIIKGSRKRRIAKGSGTTVQDVNRLLKNFTQTKKLIEKLSRKGMGGSIGSIFR